MKFLCVTCDEPMKIESAGPPEDGSITAVFGCPSCGHRIAMLTNPHETQLVQSLGVRIGPKESAAAAPGAPLAAAAEGSAESAAERAEAGGCPFAGMLGEMEAAKDDAVVWTAEAEARLQNIPEFVRPMARQGVEHYARTHGHAVVDDAVMEEARSRFGM